MAKYDIKLDPVRAAWLKQMCRNQGETAEQIITRLVHNATLDFQMVHYFASDPDETPDEYLARKLSTDI